MAGRFAGRGSRAATRAFCATHARTSIGIDVHPAPFLGRDVRERFGERPLVASEVLGAVLALAVLEVRGLHEDAGACGSRSLAVRASVVNAHGDGPGDLTRAGWAPVAPYVGDDDRAVADFELGAVIL